ncbi:hypothetical protein [Geobacter pickeringii]|uniref:Uncharacterized protein n=1 Tax=Geobacter pickeringii TaxID=345632 RepID=A0A0B5BBY9_9BACT|nr:hypothetical protein [Geobacter pickeringii]AJE02070.1 hypothetical protein GPICK_00575 [Geobacter pickeringii]
MPDQQTIETIARQHGCEDFAWISGADVQVRQWVRFKCTFGCGYLGAITMMVGLYLMNKGRDKMNRQ